jgi:hypothetical protein
VELFRKHGYAAASACAIRDWKATGGALAPAKPAPGGTLR